MKIKLPSILLFYPAVFFAQQPISNFLGGENMFYSSLMTTDIPDQNIGGGPQTWFYNGNGNGSIVETTDSPTVQEAADFPGTTHVFRTSGIIESQPTTGNVYVSIIDSNVQVLGLTIDNLTLKYNANSATVGTYPLPYGYQNFDDTVSGTFVYGSYTGTFIGVLTTSVDAYGALEFPTFSQFLVTRLRSVQDLDLSYGNFGVVGNIFISSSSYYTDNGTPEFPILRQATTSLVVPLLQINQTNTRVEFASNFASTGFEQITDNRLILSQNPVKKELEIVTDADIKTVEIFNLNGKMVGAYRSKIIDVSNLASGVYLAVVSSAYGNKILKFIKN